MERISKNIIRVNKPGDLNSSSQNQMHLSIKSLHKKICTAKPLMDITRAYRNSASSEEKQRWKKGFLPSAEFNSVCKGARRLENVSKMTGFIVLDIDRLKSTFQAEKVRDNLFNDPRLGCVLSFVSIGGNGVKAVIDIGDGVTLDNIKDWYSAVGFYLVSTYNVYIDTNACDAVRLCFLSHDPDAKFSEDGRKCSVDINWSSLSKGRSEKAKEPKKDGGTVRTFVCGQLSVQLPELLKSFAELCTRHSLSYLDEYNTWIGFGSNCRRVFNGSSEGMEVWDACSRTSPKYNRRDLVDKWGQLPEGDGEITVLGMLFNFAKRWSDEVNLQSWLHIQMSKLGMFSTIVVYSDECGKSQGLFDGSKKEADASATPNAQAFGLGDGSEPERDNPQTEEKRKTDVGSKMELLEKALGLCSEEFSLDAFQVLLCKVSGKVVDKKTALKGIRVLVRAGRAFRSGLHPGMYVKDFTESERPDDCSADSGSCAEPCRCDGDAHPEPTGCDDVPADEFNRRALDMCLDEFRYSDFANALSYVSGKQRSAPSVYFQLNKMINDGAVVRNESTKIYKKTKSSANFPFEYLDLDDVSAILDKKGTGFEKTENAVDDSTELTGKKLRYEALNLCDDSFTFTDYKHAMRSLRGRFTEDSHAYQNLNSLMGDGMVIKLDGVYHKVVQSARQIG